MSVCGYAHTGLGLHTGNGCLGVVGCRDLCMIFGNFTLPVYIMSVPLCHIIPHVQIHDRIPRGVQGFGVISSSVLLHSSECCRTRLCLLSVFTNTFIRPFSYPLPPAPNFFLGTCFVPLPLESCLVLFQTGVPYSRHTKSLTACRETNSNSLEKKK
jgi:hypothetical protein